MVRASKPRSVANRLSPIMGNLYKDTHYSHVHTVLYICTVHNTIYLVIQYFLLAIHTYFMNTYSTKAAACSTLCSVCMDPVCYCERTESLYYCTCKRRARLLREKDKWGTEKHSQLKHKKILCDNVCAPLPAAPYISLPPPPAPTQGNPMFCS
jgi:hypothetical protein